MKNRRNAASEALEDVVNKHTTDYVSLRDIKIALDERGFGLLMIIFSLPMCVPALPPGVTMIPAIPLMFFSFQMLMGVKAPWLPKWLETKKIKRSTLAYIIVKAAPYLRKVESLLYPRFSFATSKRGERVVGFFCFIFAVSIANPLPTTNLVPAIGITITSLGLLSKDGVVILVGFLIGSLGTAFGIGVTLALTVGVSSFF